MSLNKYSLTFFIYTRYAYIYIYITVDPKVNEALLEGE